MMISLKHLQLMNKFLEDIDSKYNIHNQDSIS